APPLNEGLSGNPDRPDDISAQSNRPHWRRTQERYLYPRRGHDMQADGRGQPTAWLARIVMPEMAALPHAHQL
ncbi:MAG: hypothetical protein PHW87_07950, partial [Methanothrix sp.]|nr:hypothetical protein [Methanothrix sp.]